VPGSCALEFGNVTTGVNDFGRDAGYGTNQFKKLGYDEFEGPVRPTSCS
jgi:hypothetical protein